MVQSLQIRHQCLPGTLGTGCTGQEPGGDHRIQEVPSLDPQTTCRRSGSGRHRTRRCAERLKRPPTVSATCWLKRSKSTDSTPGISDLEQSASLAGGSQHASWRQQPMACPPLPGSRRSQYPWGFPMGSIPPGSSSWDERGRSRRSSRLLSPTSRRPAIGVLRKARRRCNKKVFARRFAAASATSAPSALATCKKLAGGRQRPVGSYRR